MNTQLFVNKDGAKEAITPVIDDSDFIKSNGTDNAVTPIQQLTKTVDVDGEVTEKDIYPVTLIEAVYDKDTKKSLKEVLSEISGGGSIEVDDVLSTTSENPVQNKVITLEINGIKGRLGNIEDELFPIKATFAGGGIYEKRTTKDVTVSWTLKKGNTIITPTNVTINGEEVYPGDTSKTYVGVTDTTSYNISLTYNNNTYNGTVTAKFVNPTYTGKVSSNFADTASAITSLGKTIKDVKGGTYTYSNLNNEKICYAYPKSFGALSSIKDANNFDYINSYKRTELYIHDEDYYVYTLESATTIETFKQIYS